MIYGMWLSATGMLANQHRQAVITNNLANAQTVGFKRDVSVFQERLTEAQARRDFQHTNRELEPLGGGLLVAPTATDFSQGELETDSHPLHAAIAGDGFFTVSDGARTYLTRDGRFGIDRNGRLVSETDPTMTVLDTRGQGIIMPAGDVQIGPDGAIRVNDASVATLQIVNVADLSVLQKTGGNRFAIPDGAELRPATGVVHQGHVELSNADPALELTRLIMSQRELEINANILRLHDQTLGKLVNEVGKIG